MTEFGIQAPLVFSGSLDELYDKWAHLVLLDPESVEVFHDQLISYYQEYKDPIYLVRYTGSLGRRETICNQCGQRLRASDNAPSWWVHHLLFTEEYKKYLSFQSIIDMIPCHMFDIRLPVHINKIGWHVAHIFNVKDGNTDYHKWDAKELMRRTILNIHPCNYFYIPKTNWQTYGGDQDVIAFFYEKFKKKYHSIWNEFLHLIGEESTVFQSYAGEYKLVIDHKEKELSTEKKPCLLSTADMVIKDVVCFDDLAVWYEFSRLCFKADLIEPLSMTDKFGIITPDGVFVMTKEEFYNTFPNVIKSKSYLEKRIYHYSTPPKKAELFILKHCINQ